MAETEKKPDAAPSAPAAPPQLDLAGLIVQLVTKSPIHAVIVVLLLANLGVPIGSMIRVGGQVDEANKAIVKQLEEQNKALTKQFDDFKVSITKSMDEIKFSVAEMRQEVEAQEKLNLADKIAQLQQESYKRSVDAAALADQLKAALLRASENAERIRQLESKKQ